MEQLRSLFRSPELRARTHAAARQQESEEIQRLTARKAELEEKARLARERALQLISGNETGRRGRSTNSRMLSDALVKAQAEEQALADELQQTEAKLDALTRQSVTEDDVRRALTAIEPLWEQLFPTEQNRIVRLLVDRVEIREDGMEVALRGEGLGSVVGEITGIFEQANGRNAR